MKHHSLLPLFPLVAFALLSVVPACVCSRSSDESSGSAAPQAEASAATTQGGVGGGSVVARRVLGATPTVMTVRPNMRTLRMLPNASVAAPAASAP